jgi:NADPH:quinone reductase-like Zn-dependent oxidoreductase
MGPPDVIAIERIALPTPAEGEVLVRVHAAGVGPWDALVRAGGSGLGQTLPLTLGSEVSGVVEQIGPRTTGFAIGDEVFGATNAMFVGGYAEYAVAAARMIAPKPVEVSHAQAASMPVVAVTAWQMLFDRAKVHHEQTQLVQIAEMIKRKEVRTAVGSILPLTDARAAHEMLAGTRPHQRGKIVLQVT